MRFSEPALEVEIITHKESEYQSFFGRERSHDLLVDVSKGSHDLLDNGFSLRNAWRMSVHTGTTALRVKSLNSGVYAKNP